MDGTGAPHSYWPVSSAPYLPIFALYGDLGVSDLEEIAYKGSGLNWGPVNWAAIASWIYLFVADILLLNILIAMLSETYARVRENADIEWMHRRVRVFDEFCGGSAAVPHPFSMPFTLYKIMGAFAETCGTQLKGKQARPFGKLMDDDADGAARSDDTREADLLSTVIPNGSLVAESAALPSRARALITVSGLVSCIHMCVHAVKIFQISKYF